MNEGKVQSTTDTHIHNARDYNPEQPWTRRRALHVQVSETRICGSTLFGPFKQHSRPRAMSLKDRMAGRSRPWINYGGCWKVLQAAACSGWNQRMSKMDLPCLKKKKNRWRTFDNIDTIWRLLKGLYIHISFYIERPLIMRGRTETNADVRNFSLLGTSKQGLVAHFSCICAYALLLHNCLIDEKHYCK